MIGDSKVIGPARPLWTPEEAAHALAEAAELPYERVLAEDLTPVELAHAREVWPDVKATLVAERAVWRES